MKAPYIDPAMYRPGLTIEHWHQRIREAKEMLDTALSGELPTLGQLEEVSNLRGFIQNLDSIIFRGFDILRKDVAPKKRPPCNISIEELFS